MLNAEVCLGLTYELHSLAKFPCRRTIALCCVSLFFSLCDFPYLKLFLLSIDVLRLCRKKLKTSKTKKHCCHRKWLILKLNDSWNFNSSTWETWFSCSSSKTHSLSSSVTSAGRILDGERFYWFLWLFDIIQVASGLPHKQFLYTLLRYFPSFIPPWQ